MKGYLVGYDDDERYRVYLKEKNTIILSRDVKIEEVSEKCKRRIQILQQDIEQEKDESERKIMLLQRNVKQQEDFESDNQSEEEESEENGIETEV